MAACPSPDPGSIVSSPYEEAGGYTIASVSEKRMFMFHMHEYMRSRHEQLFQTAIQYQTLIRTYTINHLRCNHT